MSDKTAIEWAESTWNPIRGQNARHTCAKISPGCDHCYADTMTKRGLMGTAPTPYGTGETLNDPARLDEKALLQPLKWRKPKRIFVASMTDLFGTWVPDEWLDRIFGVMALTPQHTYIVLTKRPTRMRGYLNGLYDNGYDTVSGAFNRTIDEYAGGSRDFCERYNAQWVVYEPREGNPNHFEHDLPSPLPNVWAMTTIESDQYVWRADRLRQTPAAVRGISAEPLLSALPSLDLTGIDWLITGGESGPGARPMHPDWARDLRDRCAAAGVAFFHKQNGAYLAGYDRDRDDPGWLNVAAVTEATPKGQWLNLDGGQGFHGERVIRVQRVGNHKSGRLLDGREWNEMPRTAASVAGAAGGGAE